MLKDLDPLLHSQLRLAVVSILMAVEEADFVYLKEKTNSTAGNLSVQIEKLSEAGYIEANRTLDGKRTRTICKMTDKGRKAFAEYIDALKDYLNVGHF
jgi:DNA-binding MarR family transcriptional regulator